MPELSPETETMEPAGKNVIPIKSPTYQSIYSNNVGTQISFQDWALVFGEILGADEEGIHLEQKVRVIMSPQQAKLFVLTLIRNLRNYEKTFGEVKFPSEMKAEEVEETVELQGQTPST